MKRKALNLYILALTMLVALFGFAGMASAVTINGSVSDDGQLVFQFRTDPLIAAVQNSFMSHDFGLDWTSDVGMNNVRITDQDQAATTGIFSSNSGDGNLDTLTATVSKMVYGYYNELSFKIANVSTQSTIIPQPKLYWMGQPVLLIDGVVTTLYDATGKAVVEVCWLDNTGRTIYPGQVFEEAFEFHVLNVPPPPTHELNGLTPGYWKNWRNHYTTEQFAALLTGTIAGDIATADTIFSQYNAKQVNLLTILKAQLLATQLTINLTRMPDMPNPDKAYLTLNGEVEWNTGKVTVGDAINKALNVLANPSAYSRGEILVVKDLLDMINNIE